MKPNYRKYDPKSWCGDPKRGAAMGRACVIDVEDPHEFNGKLYLSKLRMVDGDYDNLGTYFGGIGDLWWCARHDYLEGSPEYILQAQMGGDLDIDFIVRAQSRDHAKQLVREKLPKARFFR